MAIVPLPFMQSDGQLPTATPTYQLSTRVSRISSQSQLSCQIVCWCLWFFSLIEECLLEVDVEVEEEEDR